MFILASKSPRRKMLMKEDIISSFDIEVASIDEDSSYNLGPIEAVKDISKRKGELIASNHYDDVVISADTIVVLDNKIIGKPKDKNDAFNILKSLSNKKHEVITGYSIFYKGSILTKCSISYVFFNNLTDELITKYIDSGSPMDKAGAYGVQDNEKFSIIKSVEGSIKNVIGFPTEDIKKDLIELGLLN